MNKTLLITGASGDIGKAICSIFIEKGYTVIGTYYNDFQSIHELSQKFGDNFHYYQCDLSDFNSADALFDAIKNDGFHVDVLINNAGISVVGLVQDLNCDIWSKLWNTNVTSALSLSRSTIPLFLKQGGGKIINISSVWGEHGASCEVGYSATKGAINALTKALAKELAPSNIQVNAISCGIIETKMNAHLTDEDLNDITAEIPLCRLGTPYDIAKAAYFLADDATYITGQILTVDGGWQI